MTDIPFTPEAIYFDTNPLIAAGWPTPSAQLLQLMNQAEKLGFPLCLPEIVNQELEGHWLRATVEDWTTANAKIDQLNKRGRSIAIFERLAPLPGEDELRNRVAQLASNFTARFKIVPITSRSLQEFVTLAIERGATFKDEGRGFQDAVILCSVLDEMIANQLGAAVLVTQDAAFGSGSANKLINSAGVVLKIVSTLDDLEQFLQGYFTAFVREYLR
ncbi:MAG TPA: PIN domain-containing protein, partial [Pirellula sp.]|nr:PIN domain-containing protein [Pirellula sp.]